MPAGEPLVAGGAVVGRPVVAGAAAPSVPLTHGRHQGGDPFRTGWTAETPATGAAGGHLVHTQTEPQSVVVVEHDLGFRPQVSLFSLDYAITYRGFGVQHLDARTLRVSMDRPTACRVVMS